MRSRCTSVHNGVYMILAGIQMNANPVAFFALNAFSFIDFGNIAAILRLHQSDCRPQVGVHTGTVAVAKARKSKSSIKASRLIFITVFYFVGYSAPPNPEIVQ